MGSGDVGVGGVDRNIVGGVVCRSITLNCSTITAPINV